MEISTPNGGRGPADKSRQQVWGWMKCNPSGTPFQHTAHRRARLKDNRGFRRVGCVPRPQDNITQAKPIRVELPSSVRPEVKEFWFSVRRGGADCQTIKTRESPGLELQTSDWVQMWLIIRSSVEPRRFRSKLFKEGRTLSILPTVRLRKRALLNVWEQQSQFKFK